MIWFVQTCLGLKYVHDMNIVHTDVKALNTFLTNKRIVKLKPHFGLSKIMRSSNPSQCHSVLGTSYCDSPEMVERNEHGFKSDIWSLGVLLYELSALQWPFVGKNNYELSTNIVKGNYRALPTSYSQDFRDLVSQLLIKNTLKRPDINQVLAKSICQNAINNIVEDWFRNHRKL